jgi:hypothetical protein
MSQPKIKITKRKSLRDARDLRHTMQSRDTYVTIALNEQREVEAVLYGPLAVEAFIGANPGRNFDTKDFPVRRK